MSKPRRKPTRQDIALLEHELVGLAHHLVEKMEEHPEWDTEWELPEWKEKAERAMRELQAASEQLKRAERMRTQQ